MTPEEYRRLDATKIGELVVSGETTKKEIIEVARQVTSDLNASLNFMASFEGPCADDSDANYIPTLIKDIGSHVGGFPFWNACRLFDGERSPQDSNYGRALKDAGGILLGVSTAPEFSLESHTQSDLFGKTLNPWDTSRSSGGSSGGAASAVAAGAVPVAHASDIAGSIRLPASWCGIVGLKPSRGRGSAGPIREEAGFGLANNFVVTRTVRDTALFLDRLSKPFPGDPFELTMPERGYVSEIEDCDVGTLKIALTLPETPDDAESEEIAQAVVKIATELESQGHIVVPVARSVASATPDDIIPLITVWHAGFAEQMDQLAARLGRKVGEKTMGPTALASYQFSKDIDLNAFLASKQQIFARRRQMAVALDEFDVVLTPTAAQLAPRWDSLETINYGDSLVVHAVEKMFPAFQFTFGHNIAGKPAISLPLGESANGLPIGVQLIAKFGREDLLLKLARRLEQGPFWSQKLPEIK